jgi:Tol biopolymer transport system component
VEFSAHLAPDGRLFFSSNADPDSLFPFGRCGIYASMWNGSSWSIPQLQWGCGDSPEYPSVSADGQWLYFNENISDGKSIFAVAWDGLGWVLPAYDLRSQIGGRSSTPSITPSGDSLFFGSGDIGGFGGRDIWIAKRVLPGKVSTTKREYLLFLLLVMILTGVYWIKARNHKKIISLEEL